jgi:glycerol kinase
MRSLLALLAAALVGAAAVAIVAPRDGAQAAGNATTMLKVGDRVQVEGQPIGCRVADQNSAVVVDCRRAGALAGTYGTMLSATKAQVVRFRSNTVAKVTFTATHHGATHRCK